MAVMSRLERRAVYDSYRWHRLRDRAIRDHLAKHGPWCPGWERDSHQAWDLTGDHIVPMSRGGAPYDPDNVQVLCNDCNVLKGGRSGLAEWSGDEAGGGRDRATDPADTWPLRESPRGVGEGDFLEQAWCEVAGGGRVHPRPVGTPCAICAAQEAETGRHERIRALTEGSR